MNQTALGMHLEVVSRDILVLPYMGSILLVLEIEVHHLDQGHQDYGSFDQRHSLVVTQNGLWMYVHVF